MKKTLFILFILSVVPLSANALPLQTITVNLLPEETVFKIGDIFSVDIVADIPNDVLGWGLDFGFNASVISQIGSPTIGPDWAAAFTPDGDQLAGLLIPTFPPTFPPAGITGEIILLATLTFEASHAGSSELFSGYTSTDLSEGFPLGFPFPSGSFANVDFNNVTVSVEPVPEPGTFILLSSGILGIFHIYNKRLFIK